MEGLAFRRCCGLEELSSMEVFVKILESG